MPGIVVGVDGSGHSRKALETAANEAAAHHAPLTVLTVHQAVRDVYGSASHYADDAAMTDKARRRLRRRPTRCWPRSRQTGIGHGHRGARPAGRGTDQGERRRRHARPGPARHRRFRPAADGLGVQPGRPARPLPGPDRARGRIGRLQRASGLNGLRSSWPRGPRDAGRRGRRRAPGEQPPRPLQILRRPELVVDDAVHVAVVLGEVARRVLEVPEEVEPACACRGPTRAVPACPRASPAPRGPRRRRHPPAFGEEGGRGGVVGAAEHGVAELARAHPVRPGEPGGYAGLRECLGVRRCRYPYGY